MRVPYPIEPLGFRERVRMLSPEPADHVRDVSREGSRFDHQVSDDAAHALNLHTGFLPEASFSLSARKNHFRRSTKNPSAVPLCEDWNGR